MNRSIYADKHDKYTKFYNARAEPYSEVAPSCSG